MPGRDYLQALGTRVIIKLVPEKERTKGGIVIPDTSRERPVEGIVTSAGEGHLLEDGKYRPLDVKVGDRVLFEKGPGTPVELNGEVFLSLWSDDLIGRITTDETAAA